MQTLQCLHQLNGVINPMDTNVTEQARLQPELICGDALEVLARFPANSVDCVITSPPYYHKRQYLSGGIGLEPDFHDYLDNLLAITSQIYRVLKPTGSFWLNIGDSYQHKQLLNIPHRLAIRMQDE